MSPSSWQASLQLLIKQRTAESRIAIVGIGNAFRSDDAAGIRAAHALMDSRVIRDIETVLVMDGGHAPENATGQLRRFEPNIVLLIDAADMGEHPGTVRLIDLDEIEGMSASTHSLPLSMLANYLVLELGCTVNLLGIQPKSNEVGELISPEVAGAVREVVDTILESFS